MEKDLWDLAERAAKIVKEQIKEDIKEEEMTGIFYQEFNELTVAEKQILNGLEIGQKAIIQDIDDKIANGKECYIEDVNVQQEYHPILVSFDALEIDYIGYERWVKRENLRGVENE